MFLQRPNNPVRNDYAGPALVIKDLETYCNAITGNLTAIESEIMQIKQLAAQERQLNAQLVDFATWVIAQHPKAIHEYKSVATTLNALASRDDGDEVHAQSAP